MPTIQMQNPLGAAVDAVTGFLTQKRDNELQQRALDYQKSRDARHDMESDRTFGVEQGRAADEHARTQSDLQTAEQQRAIAADTEAFQQQMRPLLLAAQQAKNKLDQGALVTQQDQHALAQADLAVKAFDRRMQQKYGEAQVQGQLAQLHAQIGLTGAETESARASAGLTAAETARTNKETQLLGTGAIGGRYGTRGTAAERAQAEYDDALAALSPQGRQFYDMLYSTNNAPTRAQAMLALNAAMTRRGRSSMSPADAKHLETLIASRESQFVAPSAQAAERRYEERNARSDAQHAERDAETHFRDVVQHTKAYRSLPPQLQDLTRHLLVDLRLDVNGAAQQVQQSTLPDEVKQRVTQALTGAH